MQLRTPSTRRGSRGRPRRWDQIDLQAATGDRNLEEHAYEQGRRNLPPAGAAVPDAMECLISDHFESEHQSLTLRVLDHVRQTYRAALDGLAHRTPHALTGLMARLQVEVTASTISDKTELLRRRAEERAARQYLKKFRAAEHITRPAEMPSSRVFHFAIVAVVIVLESAANMYFFAQGSELGLLGGLLQALIVSLANVGLAVATGMFVLPYLNHRRPSAVMLASFGLSMFVGFVLFFNLAASHYRDLLEVDFDGAMVQALPSLMRDPTALSFNSLTLLGVGLLAAGLGLYKGYTADDRYPGLGRAQRRYMAARGRFEVEVDKVRSSLIDTARRVREETTSLLKRNADRLTRVASLLEDVRTVEQGYENLRGQLETECHHSLRRYREANQLVRDLAKHPAPEYFKRYPEFENALSGRELFGHQLQLAEKSLRREHEEQERLVESVAQLNIEMARRVQATSDRIDAFVAGASDYLDLEISVDPAGGEGRYSSPELLSGELGPDGFEF